MGSNATYQCRDGSSDVYTTQCTSDGMWEPNPNSTLDCSMNDYAVPRKNGLIVVVIILVIVTGITIIVVAVFYWRINTTSEPQHDLMLKVLFFSLCKSHYSFHQNQYWTEIFNQYSRRIQS